MSWMCFTVHAQDTNRNYIKVYKPNVELSNESSLKASSKESCQKSIEYFDDLGRPDQLIQVAASPNGYDMVQPIEYDQFGREKKKYLPYTLSSTNNGGYVSEEIDPDKWNAHYGTIEKTYAFSEVEFDNSPLNRVMEQGASGQAWQVGNGHTVRNMIESNSLNDQVIHLEINRNDQLENNAYYLDNELFKLVVKNENWTSGKTNTTEKYKNKAGKVILKRAYLSDSVYADTYYVYDNVGLLRYVFPSEAIQQLFKDGVSPTDVVLVNENESISTPAQNVNTYIVEKGASLTLSNGFTFSAEDSGYDLTFTSGSIQTDLCYTYKYDGLHRMIEKKLPGAKPIYMVYDKRNRLVLSQDGNQREDDKWMYTEYDIQNRAVETGYYTNTQKTHTELQDIVGASSNYIVSGGIALTRTHYDNYDISSTWGFNFSNPSNFSTNSQAECSKGLMTGRETKSLESELWLKEVFYYDKYGRLLQAYKVNHLGGYDKITNLYDFVGNVKLSQESHKKLSNSTAIVIEKEFIYDHKNRLSQVYHQIGNQTPVLIVENKYNELGQLEEKDLHNGIQSVDYRYNIRGWLSSINNSNLNNDGSLNNDSNDLFGMEFGYNAGVIGFSGGSSTSQYNGNISWMSWKKTDSSTKLGYSFAYDALNRLKKTDFLKVNSNSNVSENTPTYNFVTLDYDLNGNITSLNRKKHNIDEFIDELTYKYQGNQLYNVDESATGVLADNGFKQLSSGSGLEYLFDANGNLTKDENRGHEIAYNLLNLPKSINNTTLKYNYSASGAKYQKLFHDGTNETVTDYIGNYVYKDGVLSYIITSEGRIVETSGGYQYEYNLKDHLGNTRVSFKADSVSAIALQYKDYYPFGMAFTESLNNDNKYLYNGKELQDEMINGDQLDWLDYGARMYDAQLGRFSTQDRFSEKYIGFTPYQYAGNNPIVNIDINGDSIMITHRKEKIIYKKSNLYWAKTGKAYNGKALKIKKDGTTKLKGFVGKTLKALNKIKNGGKAGAELISGLENDKGYAIVGKGKNKANGVFAKWKPSSGNSGLDTNGDTKRPSYIGLAHELAHVLDILSDGKLDMGKWYEEGGKRITNAEIYATHVENQVRAENGVALRTHYGLRNNLSTGALSGSGRVIVSGTSNVSQYYNAGFVGMGALTIPLPFIYGVNNGL